MDYPKQMTTILLYLTDAYLKTFDAEVLNVNPERNGVLLSRTAFYPGGGGQPRDEGILQSGEDVFTLVAIEKSEGEYWHILDKPAPPAGTVVKGTINWDRRYGLMRTHTAMHILCGVIYRDFQAPVTGDNMEPLTGRMDFEFERMTGDLVKVVEERVNHEIGQAKEITVKILPRAEADKIPDLIRTKTNLLPPGLTEIRTVEIKGLDLQADGGTHVKNTREVGKVEIFDYQSKGRINKRVKIRIMD